MKMGRILGASVLVTLATVGCKQVKPTMPTKKVPAGIVEIDVVKKPTWMTRRWWPAITGPVDLTLDGVRIPVEQGPKGGSRLLISGLAPGKHRYFITSPHDAFGPDQGEFEVVANKGTYVLLFNSKVKSQLYGNLEPLPKAEGMPGVTARLIK